MSLNSKIETRCRLLAALIIGMWTFVAAGLEADEPLANEMRAMLESAGPEDYDRLQHTCFSEFEDWTAAAVGGGDAAWSAQTFAGLTRFANAARGQAMPPRLFLRPSPALTPLTGWFAVPERGTYRMWLGAMRSPDAAESVMLRLSGATTAEHQFGATPLTRGKPGRELEASAPLRFETDDARAMPVMGPLPVWEYWDVELEAGATLFTFAPQMEAVALEALVLTRSLRFTPRLAFDAAHNTLTRVFLRYRVAPAEAGSAGSPVTLGSEVVFNWDHNNPSSASLIYQGSVGDITAVDGSPTLAPGAWSAWVDATETAVLSRGRYVTDNLTLAAAGEGVRPTNAVVTVQYAWFPHPGAVLREVQAKVTSGGMRYTIPAARRPYRAVRPGTNVASAAWGARDPAFVAGFRGEKEILEDLFARLDLPADVVMPQQLVFSTDCGVSPEYRALAVDRLKAVGINALGFPPELSKHFGLLPHLVTKLQEPRTLNVGDTHDPADPTFEASVRQALEARFPVPQRDAVTLFGMGDEIGPVSPHLIRQTADGRHAFQVYLAGELDRMGTNAWFFGVPTLDRIVYPLVRPGRGSREQRRLWFHAEDFLWRYTSDYYSRYTRAINAVLPRARTWCNVTPGSFMNSGTMRRSNWFALPRHGGATMGWGEDWLRGDDVQPVSYYAALLACATRKRQLPSGFYLVVRTGNSHRKIFSLVSRGVHQINLYTWGPEYAGYVGERFSHITTAYPEIARGIRALVPAETIITRGTPEPRRAAVLYNLTHEYWNGSEAALHRDRLGIFTAILHAHVPADVILEEDLTPETLAAYPVVYINGFNMQRRHIEALTEWVKAGGVLVATSGAALRDEYDDPSPEAEFLFGARQRLIGEPDAAATAAVSAGEPDEPTPAEPDAPMPEETDEPTLVEKATGPAAGAPVLTLAAGELTPAVSLPAIGAQLALTPTAGRSVGVYADGSCGAVLHELGKGRVLLLGVLPGHAYRQAAAGAQASGIRRAITAPALMALGPLSVEYSEPLVELARFDHAEGLAVMLNDFSRAPGREAVLTVRTDRPITDVVASHGGKLVWKREGDAICIQCPVPHPVDVVILK